MSKTAPELLEQRDGAAAYHFLNGETLDAGALPADGLPSRVSPADSDCNPDRAGISVFQP